MAIVGVFTNAYVSVNGVDLSDHGRSITVSDERAAVDVTAFGAGYVQETKGLGTATISIGFLQDLSAAKVHATLQPLIGSSTPVAVEVRAVNSGTHGDQPGHGARRALCSSPTRLLTGRSETRPSSRPNSAMPPAAQD